MVAYQAVLNAETGEIKSLSKTTGFENDMIDIVVRDLLKQSFPSIKRQGLSLTQAEGDNADEQEIVFGTTFDEVPVDVGLVEAEINVQENEESIFVDTYYTEEDLVEFSFDLGGQLPEITFEETRTISKELGLVSHAERTYSFSLNSGLDNLSQNEDDEEEDMMSIEVLGAMSVQITTQIELGDITFDSTMFFNDLPLITQEVDLSSNQGSFWMHPQVQEDNLQASNPVLGQEATFEKDYKVFEKSIFGNAFGLNVNYKNLGEKSNILVTIYLNSKTIFKLLEFSYNHCPGSFDKSKDFSYSLTLFKVSFPVLGIITIPVEASLRVNYGWIWKYGSSPNVNGCNLTFQPYFKPGFDASGAISAVIAKAGIYATGTVANSYLAFTVDVWGIIPLTNGKVELNVSIIPFEYDVGAFYQLWKCDLKKLFSF